MPSSKATERPAVRSSVLFSLCCVLGRPVAAQAATDLRGTHEIALNIGLLTSVRTTTAVTVSSTTIRSDAGGAVVSLGYGYWVSGDWSVQTSIGVAAVDASVSTGGASASVASAVVVPVLFGVKYQPQAMLAGERLRPYAAVGVGPYFGHTSSVRAGLTTVVEARSETAIGARLVIGLDLTLGRRFSFGVAAGYRPVADFNSPIGARTNYSSPDISLGFGVRLGGGNR